MYIHAQTHTYAYIHVKPQSVCLNICGEVVSVYLCKVSTKQRGVNLFNLEIVAQTERHT